MRGSEDDVGWGEAAAMRRDLGSLAGQPHRRRADPDGDPTTDERRRHRVVDVEDPDEGVDPDPGLGVEVGIGERIGQRGEEAALGSVAIADPAAETSDMAAEGDVGRPGVVLVLEVRQVLEPAQRQEARLGIADRPLGTALGRRPRRAQHDRLGPERPEQARDLYDTFAARELRRLPTSFGDPYAPVDLSADEQAAPAAIRELHVDRSAARGPDAITLEELAELDLDVLICPSPSAVPRELLALPRLGSWDSRARRIVAGRQCRRSGT